MKEDTSQELRIRILDEAARQFDKKGTVSLMTR